LKKVNLVEWKKTNTTREQIVTSKFLLKSRDEYKMYNNIVGMVRKLAETLARLADNNPTKILIGKKLINLLYDIGIIREKKLSLCANLTVSQICYRRLGRILVEKKMAPDHQSADRFVQQGHIRLGTRVVNTTDTLISRMMEDYVTWTDSSKIKKKIDEFNGNYDDYKYTL
jgi:U3 small nucleolar ribonucleoprotein protein IMP3